MGASAVGSKSALQVQSLVNMRRQLDDLQRQLGTGKKSDTYAGLGLERGLSVGLRSHLTSIDSYKDTMSMVSVRMDLASSALTRITQVGRDIKSAIVNSPYEVDGDGKTIPQKTALADLSEVIGLLNTRAGDRYVFSGLAGDTPAVVSMDHMLYGDGAKAGLRQLMSERLQADGGDAMGRLVIAPLTSSAASVVGTGATLLPDAAAAVTGSQDISALASAGGTLVINGTPIAIGVGANAAAVQAAIQAQVGTTGVGAAIVANNLVLTGVDADTVIDVDASSTGTVLTELGIGAVATNPTNLMTQGAATQGQTMNIAVGSDPPNAPLAIVFGTGVGEVSTMAELNAALGTVAGGTASIDGTGNVTVTATNTSDAIALTGTATMTNFGLATTSAAAGNMVSLSEDVSPSVFGMKLASVTSNLAGSTVVQPTGTPPAMSVDLGSVNPTNGQTVQFRFTLPDGTTENLVLTASTATPLGKNEFAIGATPDVTAANLRAALNTGVGTVAKTALAAASATVAADNFFNTDAANPPQRVNGPPFNTATTMIDGTPANTVSWYTGEAGTTDARLTSIARIDQSISINYGLRANEEGIRFMVQNIALVAAMEYPITDANGSARALEFSDRMIPALNVPQGTQKIDNVLADLGSAGASMKAAKARHAQTAATLADMLDGVEGVSNEQIATEMLTLNTRLQASLQTTAMLYQTSLVNFL
jgi:flagellin-like hook-associated protein FlgL